MGFLVFDPRKLTTEMKDATLIENYKQLAGMANKFMDEVVAARRAKGKHEDHQKDGSVWSCPAKSRKTGEIRFFNFRPTYQGRLDHGEAMFKGAWCLASDEEEAAEYARQAAHKIDAAVETIRLQEQLNRKDAGESPAYREALKTIHNAAGAAAPISETEKNIQTLRERAEKAEKELEALKKQKPDATNPAASQGHKK